MECKKCGSEMLVADLKKDEKDQPIFREYCPKCERVDMVEGKIMPK